VGLTCIVNNYAYLLPDGANLIVNSLLPTTLFEGVKITEGKVIIHDRFGIGVIESGRMALFNKS